MKKRKTTKKRTRRTKAQMAAARQAIREHLGMSEEVQAEFEKVGKRGKRVDYTAMNLGEKTEREINGKVYPAGVIIICPKCGLNGSARHSDWMGKLTLIIHRAVIDLDGKHTPTEQCFCDGILL